MVLTDDEEPGLEPEELLHAPRVRRSAAAPARQAVRIDISRNLTAFTYSLLFGTRGM
jgi:hypothetical protein